MHFDPTNILGGYGEGIMVEVLWFIVVGIVAGWLASVLVKGHDFGLVGDLVLGIVGALLGGLLFGFLGFGGLIGSIVVATLGAIVLLALIRLIKRV